MRSERNDKNFKAFSTRPNRRFRQSCRAPRGNHGVLVSVCASNIEWDNSQRKKGRHPPAPTSKILDRKTEERGQA